MRATSTVLDVLLCLLLVSASAGVIVDGVPSDDRQTEAHAAAAATTLTATTATVEYRLDPADDPPSWVANPSARHRRTAHGTLASLLAEAALSRTTVRGHRVSTASREFERRVARITMSRLRRSGVRFAVDVRWTPYRGAPVNGSFHVGGHPPPQADVQATTFRVDSGMAPAEPQARSIARGSRYYGVAMVAADRVVGGRFPPDRTRIALRGDYPDDTVTATRYRRAGRLVGAGPLHPGRTSVADLNSALVVGFAGLLHDDMQSRFERPTAAAAALRTESVRITVRAWSP